MLKEWRKERTGMARAPPHLASEAKFASRLPPNQLSDLNTSCNLYFFVFLLQGGEECHCRSYLNKYYIFMFQNSELQKGFRRKVFPTVSLPPSSPPNLKSMLLVSPFVLSEILYACAMDFYCFYVGGRIIHTHNSGLLVHFHLESTPIGAWRFPLLS